ncbi:DnaD domain protein [Periweissella ghanensis]|uniref:Replication initiation and membrane attachment protein n=1 Tax=Periweissella ghanensis TaxID=467997 RepID=A0ABM8ZB26_9LACO|nr:DnaD domain protein [Periweissella ghanensis]MCM0600696.1 DnaD domain protein [Periweissella ghanensis]CAH0418511.1 Replication initiation and membrane attachment protein [Periweissella ghanensis]
MTDLNHQLNPMSGFILSEGAKLTDYDQSIITALYQPIIGPDAMVLLNTFWNLIEEQPRISERILHTTLMNIVNLAPQAIVAARGRLEAVNLMQTWHNTDTLGEYYVYELHAPLQPQQFFTDELMSVLLLSAVESSYYQKLQQRFQLRQLVQIDGDNISQKITDVFNVSSEAFQKVASLTPTPTQRQVTAKIAYDEIGANNSATFDFELIVDSLQNTGINRQTLELKRNMLFALHQTVGINELELSKYIRKTMTFDTFEINDDLLKQQVIDAYRPRPKQAKEATKIAATPTTAKVDENELATLPVAVQTVLRNAQELNPREFLQSVKEEKNGFPTANEVKTITDVIEANVLPLEVVNILIFYVLITLGRDNINRAYFNSIANTLSQNHVADALNALKFLGKFQREQQNKVTKKYATGRSSKKVETKPTYATTPAPTVTANELAATQASLERLKQSRIQHDKAHGGQA